jgi:hypothetical protein
MTETEFRLTVNGAERSVTCERVAPGDPGQLTADLSVQPRLIFSGYDRCRRVAGR